MHEDIKRSIHLKNCYKIHRLIGPYQEMSERHEVRTDFTLTSITDEHILNLDVLCQRLETNLVRGMKKGQVKKILKESGENKFRRPKKIFSMDFSGLKERKERREKFSKSEWKRVFGQQLPGEVTVIRDGVRVIEMAKNIVVGDLIELEVNEIVPADIRLIWAKHLIVDNRLITGNLCEKRTHFLQEATDDPIVSPNMIFACTRIISGHCLGVVLRTGEETVFGTLKNFAQKVKVRKKSSTSSVSILSSSSTEYHRDSMSSCRTLSEPDVSTTMTSKNKGKIQKKGSTSSSISSSSSDADSTSDEGSISGKYRQRGLTRSVSQVLEDLDEDELCADYSCGGCSQTNTDQESEEFY